ncbi:hypothetical protein BJ170DRAFT_290561 [Xylariales sp. AK1849]|nr:hypothetical protein BJ170DRAFT_290561 [Xylariales sp. AK1849]
MLTSETNLWSDHGSRIQPRWRSSVGQFYNKLLRPQPHGALTRTRSTVRGTDDTQSPERRSIHITNSTSSQVIPCEFVGLSGCDATFHPNRTDQWVEHVRTSHLDCRVPSKSICWFCDESPFGADKRWRQDDPRRHFDDRLDHISSHLSESHHAVHAIRPNNIFSLNRVPKRRYSRLMSKMDHQKGCHSSHYQLCTYMSFLQEAHYGGNHRDHYRNHYRDYHNEDLAPRHSHRDVTVTIDPACRPRTTTPSNYFSFDRDATSGYWDIHPNRCPTYGKADMNGCHEACGMIMWIIRARWCAIFVMCALTTAMSFTSDSRNHRHTSHEWVWRGLISRILLGVERTVVDFDAYPLNCFFS